MLPSKIGSTITVEGQAFPINNKIPEDYVATFQVPAKASMTYTKAT
jgi:hypothetical protein